MLHLLIKTPQKCLGTFDMLFLVFCDEHLGNHLLNTFRYLRIFIKIMCMESLLYTFSRLLAISRVTLQFCSTSSSTFFTVVSKYNNLLLCSMLWIFARSKKNSMLNVQTFFTFVHFFSGKLQSIDDTFQLE